MQAETATMPVQPLEQPNYDYVGSHRAAEEEATRMSWRARLGQIAGRAALALGLAGGIAGVGMASESTPAEASSVSCYGDYCSGQYANDTGCDQDAVTLDQKDITQQNYTLGLPLGLQANGEVNVGTVELRYSQTCKTKWARAKTYMHSGVSDVAVTQDTGYNQGRHVGGFSTGSPAAISVSPMIYSPNNAVHAYVGGGSGDLINVSTNWR